MDPIIVKINNISDTRLLAEIIAGVVKEEDAIFLKGDLGAGKTTFAKYLIHSLTKELCSNITSPTFTIVNVYDEGKIPVYHYDLYRLKSSEELYELGIEEALKYGVTVIEWPEYAENIIRNALITIYFNYNAKINKRTANLVLDSSLWKNEHLIKRLNNDFNRE